MDLKNPGYSGKVPQDITRNPVSETILDHKNSHSGTVRQDHTGNSLHDWEAMKMKERNKEAIENPEYPGKVLKIPGNQVLETILNLKKYHPGKVIQDPLKKQLKLRRP